MVDVDMTSVFEWVSERPTRSTPFYFRVHKRPDSSYFASLPVIVRSMHKRSLTVVTPRYQINVYPKRVDMKRTKICDGKYEYSAGGFSVTVSQMPSLLLRNGNKPTWIAVAQWSNSLFTPPLPTKQEAINAARAMLNKKLAT